MKIKIIFFAILSLSILFTACTNNDQDWDAAGAFESVETIISTEASGTLLEFNVEEGQVLKPGQMIGHVDSIQLHLRKMQLQAQINSTLVQKPNIPVQLASLERQLAETKINQRRIRNLLKANAATQQQLDDANTLVEVNQKQIVALKSTLGITTQTLTRETEPLGRQIAQLNDQIEKCLVVNKVAGTVLTKYAEVFEVVTPGKALYKIARTDTLILRAYITGTQLTNVRLGQKVKVRSDEGATKYRSYDGVIYWISDKSEFTPKTIPTKDERADLVYAIKVWVPNRSGYLKIGMYGQLKF